MSMERVEQRLLRVTAALDSEDIPYAVVGGNAVAAWVSRIDPGATRTTKDVDLLVNRSDLDRVSQVFHQLGFLKEDLRRLVLFVDPEEPNRKTGVHLVWAGEPVRPSYLCPAPSVDETERDPLGYRVLTIKALTRMKLTSHRDIDRVHIADLLSVGLIDNEVRNTLPPDLLDILQNIEKGMENEYEDD